MWPAGPSSIIGGMSRTRLFCRNLSEGRHELSPEESHHAVAARRVRVGDEVDLFDGGGGEAIGRVLEVNRRSLVVEAGPVTRHTAAPAIELTLATAVCKAQRQSYLIEKCTELGVGAIWPLSSARSVVKAGPGTIEKWTRRAIEAAKQSRRPRLPEIAATRTLADVVAQFGSFDAVAMADTSRTGAGLNDILSTLAAGSRLLVLIGPEGGWSDEERERLVSAGVRPVRLAETVLRTETAAVAACAAVALYNACA